MGCILIGIVIFIVLVALGIILYENCLITSTIIPLLFGALCMCTLAILGVCPLSGYVTEEVEIKDHVVMYKNDWVAEVYWYVPSDEFEGAVNRISVPEGYLQIVPDKSIEETRFVVLTTKGKRTFWFLACVPEKTQYVLYVPEDTD